MISGKSSFCRVIFKLLFVVCFGVLLPRATAGEAQGVPRFDRLGDPLPTGAVLRLGTTRFRHPSIVNDLALSPDEKSVVAIGREGLMVWDTKTGKLRWQSDASAHKIDLPAASYGIRGLAFSAGSSHFYTPGKYNEVLVWDTQSGQKETISIANKLPIHAFNLLIGRRLASPRSIDVTADGNRIALGSAHGLIVGDQEGKALFYVANSPASQVEIESMNQDRLNFGGHYSYARFSPDEKLLAVVVSEAPYEIRLLDAETGQQLRRIELSDRLVRLAFSPDSKNIVTTERDSAVRSYAVDSGKNLWSYEIELKNKSESYTSAIAVSSDGKMIAACAPIGSDNLIHLLEAATGKLLDKLAGHTWKPWAVAFTADSKTIFSSGWDGVIRRWDVATRKQLPLPEGVRATGVVAASPDGKMLAYADDSGTVHLVDPQDASERGTLSLPEARYSQLAFSADRRRLAGGGTCGDQVHVAVWDLAEAKLHARWDWPKGDDTHSHVESLSFSPNGKQLAAAVFRQDKVTLWDLETSEEVAQLMHDQVYGLAFSPGGKTLATVGWDQLIQFWDCETGELNDVIVVEGIDGQENDLRVWEASYSPDGDLLATAHLDQTIRIWQVDEMLLRSHFKMKGIFRHGVLSFSPDGLWVAAGTSRGCASLWEPLTGELVWDAGCHEAAIYTVGFGRDSRTLVSGASDGTCYLWNTRPTGKLPDAEPEQLWNDLAADGLAAYQAMWALLEMPDRAVELLREKLHPVERLIDLEYVSLDIKPEEVERQRLLNENLIQKEESVERTVTVRRALSLLAQIDTPDAIALLTELKEQGPDGEVGRLAAAALALSATD